MENIGQKIVELRKSKGYTQEDLAEKAKVNLRTIQRIENDENKPSGNTLKLISEALDSLPEKIIDYGKKEDLKLLVLMHLSVVTYLVIPIGNILIPLIFWISKKDKIIKLDEKGTSLLNFQIIWTILTTITLSAALLTATLELTNPENGYISYVLLFLFVILNIINVAMAVIIAYRIKRKSKYASYPNLIRIIK
ncbi:helix-turn-helix domain-containing protein [uncultured Maribacter sp.]|uniref:helix-turn-helix domain-containing protein n=1 Tax=uncultured Maribacter sp. TaxID=431308 RepID=UPI0030EF2992|tara:strand:- start:2837 stop:3418 length:582 start_codon:yes stop_codon:yes gene_type:complete